MTEIPPRHNALWIHPKWDAALGRRTTIEDVLAYIKTHWVQLQQHPPREMMFSENEPKITKYFRLSLRANKTLHGITGFFTAEDEVGKINTETQEVGDRGRTDITYNSDRIDPPLTIVFEFKKLKLVGENIRRNYCTNGMGRFVSGIYAEGDDVAFMIGLVQKESTGSQMLLSLQQAIQKPAMVGKLRLIQYPKGSFITTSPKSFSISDFETQHARDHVANCPDMLLGHFLLFHET